MSRRRVPVTAVDVVYTATREEHMQTMAAVRRIVGPYLRRLAEEQIAAEEASHHFPVVTPDKSAPQ